MYKSNFSSFPLSGHIQHRSFSEYNHSTCAFSFLRKKYFFVLLVYQGSKIKKTRTNSWRHERLPLRTRNSWLSLINAVRVPVHGIKMNHYWQTCILVPSQHLEFVFFFCFFLGGGWEKLSLVQSHLATTDILGHIPIMVGTQQVTKLMSQKTRHHKRVTPWKIRSMLILNI